ncbi:MAG: IS1595 family transposase [Alphaproteobacteria bacterium]|nr:IS1595 family transposase [Alphaproteobacteria bacterium]
MARNVLSAPHFQDENAAFAYVESHLWPNGPKCPFCGSGERVGRLAGKTTRPGLHKCYECKKPFTVRMGTIFESSHLPLHLWLQVIHLMCASKKGISTRQIQRLLRCSMKTAWFLTHRIREIMKPAEGSKLGGEGKTVEADETFLTNSRHTRKRRGASGNAHCVAVLSLVERGGNTRSMRIDGANMHQIKSALWRNVDPKSRLVTDGAQAYRSTVPLYASKHQWVDHSKEYVTDGDVHTNTLEDFFSVFKRGMVGTYQHVSERHLDRYLAEFDFRQNTRERLGVNDVMRSEIALAGAVGKRLTYQTTSDQAPPF